ncbi:MAG: class I SAM-dependent methyltransferase [Proteobacteria bacterium]|nr:class I SAM-dependent methyltransferase [Pseudomonadota bacterium]
MESNNEKETAIQKKSVVEAYRTWAPRMAIHRESAFHVIEKALTERTLRKYLFQLPESASILDVGGGDGRWSIYLAKHGFTNVLMADLTPELVDVARKNAVNEKVEDSITFRNLDIENLALENQFDAILCLGGVLSHCPDYELALRNVYTALRGHGLAVLSVDSFFEAKITAQFVENDLELDELLQKGVSKQFFNLRLPYYSKYFRYEELHRTLSICGFGILQVTSRPQMTEFDISRKFQSDEEFRNTLEKEIRLAGRKELLDYGCQLEVVATKEKQQTSSSE